MMLIDTHVHLNDEQYDEDLNEVISRAQEAGVDRMFVVGFDTPTIERTMELIDKYEFIYGIIGWHPVDAIDCTEERLEWIESLSKHPKIIGIGEMGLDYHWDKSPADVQKEVFRKQIALAKRVKLPIIIHNREATQDCVDILMEEHAEEVGGIMHSFSASPEIADVVINKLISMFLLVVQLLSKMPNSLKKWHNMYLWIVCYVKLMHHIYLHILIEVNEMNQNV